jgi:hypothetical protein
MRLEHSEGRENRCDRMSCFGKGTLVRTIDGMRPIEELNVGDKVLAQDTKTGKLGYRPVLVVHRNKVGDPIRTLGSVSKVTAIEADKVQPVFNFNVADAADFFTGSGAALVHDNTLPDLRQAPFDAPPAVAVAR